MGQRGSRWRPRGGNEVESLRDGGRLDRRDGDAAAPEGGVHANAGGGRRRSHYSPASMLAYRHAFHAGNHADVLKHVVLALVLRHMNAKNKG